MSHISQELNNIRSIFVELLMNNEGKCNLAEMPNILKNNHGIDYKTFSGGKKFKLWLEENFGDMLYFVGDYCFSKEYVKSILTNLIEENGGKYLLSAIVPVLSNNYGIDYKSISNGEKLQPWLKNNYDDVFEISDDGYNLKIRVSSAAVSTERAYNKSVEITQMHSISFMSWWSNNAKVLQRYSGQAMIPEEWSSIVARNLALAISGVETLYTYIVDDKVKMVFNTGVKTIKDNRVFCILQTNPLGNNGDKQKYVFACFCCPVEEENEAVDELKAYLPELFRSENGLRNKYEELYSHLGSLNSIRNRIKNHIPAMINLIDEGKPIDPEQISLLNLYKENWDKTIENLDFLGFGKENPDDISIDILIKRFESSHRQSDVFKNAVEQFISFAGKIIGYCSVCKLNSIVAVIRSDIETAQKMTVDSVDDFRSLVVYYQHFMELTNNIDGETATDSLEIVKNHFPSYSSKIWGTHFVNTPCEELGIENKSIISDILELLSSVELITDPEKKDSEKIAVDCDSLLETVLLDPDDKEIASIYASTRYFCSSKFERAIVSADYDKCRSIIESGKDDVLYNKPRDLLASAVENVDQIGRNEMTFYAIGSRMLSLIGNINKTAEKYFIVGLLTDPVNCSNALVELYLKDNNNEGFLKIWNKYKKLLNRSNDVIRYLLNTIALKGENEFKQCILNDIAFIFIPEICRSINDLADEYGFSDVKKLCGPRLDHIRSLSRPNEFEECILKDNKTVDNSVIKEHLDDFKSNFDSLGYSDEEVDAMYGSLTSIDSESGNLSPVKRLYSLQKNKNNTVEQYIWDSLKNRFDEDNCILLMEILCSSERFDDACLLFECYKDVLINDGEARQFYLLSLIKTNNNGFYDFVCSDMQDFVTLIINKTVNTSDLDSMAAYQSIQGNTEFASFIEELINICGYSDNYVIGSIITLSPDLREIALDPDLLAKNGLGKEAIDGFAIIFKTDNYSRGRSILDIANRLNSFVGAQNEATVSFANFALKNGQDASNLLWDIYSERGDNDSMFKLLSDNPQMQKAKDREYCTLLFLNKDYERFFAASETIEEKEPNLLVQTIIAKCNLGISISDDITNITSIADIKPDWCIEMIDELFKNSMIDEAENFISWHFEEALSSYSEEEVRRFVSANDNFKEEELKKIQKSSSKSNRILAIYIFESFGIGRYKTASKEFVSRYLSSDSPSSSDLPGSVTYHQMKSIYQQNKELLSKIFLHEISGIIEDNNSTDEAEERIKKAMDGVSFDSEGIVAFLNLLKNNSVVFSPEMYLRIVNISTASNIRDECIDYLHHAFSVDSSFRFEDNGNQEIFISLCDLYNYAFEQNGFKEKWTDISERICINLIKNNTEYYGALYCLFNIERLSGNKYRAKFVMRILLDEQYGIPEYKYTVLRSIADEMQINESTTVFDLFVEMAGESTKDDIIQYCHFCGLFINDKSSLVEYYNSSLINNATDNYSAEDCIVLLKLLYSNPKSIDYWTQALKIPFDENLSIHAKILYILSILQNKESTWKKCIDACERCSQEELLMEVLLDCSRIIPSPYGTQNIRILLADKVSTNPMYFSQYDSKKCTELISIMAQRLDAESSSPGIRHNAIRDIATIAISTDSTVAFKEFMKHFEKSVYSENYNLGFAIVCRLILRNRIEEALPILKMLKGIPTVKYGVLISELSDMDLSEFSEWASKKINRRLLDLIIPDGNYPDIDRINDLALAYSSKEKAEDGAFLLCKLIENAPNDYGCYMALFILCKQLPNRIDLLHKALCGLIKYDPVGKSKSFYSRTRKDYAVLLANVNEAIIALQKTEEVSTFDGYDFNLSAREFYQKYETRYDDDGALSEIKDAQDNIQRVLANQSVDSTNIICDLVFCHVTGSWSKLLVQCWKKDIDIISYINYFSEYPNGLAKSVLEIAYSLNVSEQQSFISWIKNDVLMKCSDITPEGSIGKQIRIALQLFEKDYYRLIPSGVFEDNFFSLPFEEYSLFNLVFKKTILQLITKAPGYVYPCAILVGYLAYSTNAMSVYFHSAMKSFELSNDIAAHGLFSTLNELHKKEKLEHKEEKDTRKNGEIYESMMRVSGVFSKNERIISYVSKTSFNPWSCMNMVFALLYTPRANEINRLKQYFSSDNQMLTDALLTIVNNNNDDSEKIKALSGLSSDIVKGLLCFLMRSGNREDNKYVFVKEEASIRYIKRLQERITSNNPQEFFPNYSPKHFLWIDYYRINENAYEQLEENDEHNSNETPEEKPQDEEIVKRVLSFVSDLEPVSGPDKSIEELWEEHSQINPFGLDNYGRRLDISRLIYQIALSEELGEESLNDYAIRYGVDRYYYCMANKQYSEANAIILEMVGVYDSNFDTEGNQMLKAAVCSTALHELIYRGYSSIRDMVDDYVRNRQSFIKMRNMLPASTMSIELYDVNSIYSALETIAKCLSEISVTHTDAYRNALLNAKTKLDETTTVGWNNLKLSVRQMIQEELNRITQRPILEPEIINKTSNLTYGSIFGQIQNVGNDTAENITLQLDFSDGKSSIPYTLTRLVKGDTAAFEIRFSSPKGTKRIDYDISLTYERSGEKYSKITNNCSLIIEESEFIEYPLGQYQTQYAITNFIVRDDGTLYNPDFFGRDEEKKKIHSLFNGEFADYKNTIIKGIRRAGKTSVLYYILTYAKTKCNDTIAVYTTCNGVKAGNQPIQETLVKHVLYECRTKNIGNKSAEEWYSFEKKWELPEGKTDRDAEELQYFYRELKDLNGGKGLILIIDEFDELLEELEKTQEGINSTFLPSMRNLINNVYCFDVIRLVICGSNKLIRYMDGGAFNQFFQQFGDSVIEIGRLSEREMRSMLIYPYKDHPNVKFTESSIKWIWKYTKGLVWYSKLIAGRALERACSNKRYVVYPSDVVHAMTEVASNKQYFENLLTSCNSKELKILDLIQSQTSKATEYISANKLLEVLEGDFSKKEAEGTLNTLVTMQILQRNLSDRSSYRFSVELYWFFFRGYASNFERIEEVPDKFNEAGTTTNEEISREEQRKQQVL